MRAIGETAIAPQCAVTAARQYPLVSLARAAPRKGLFRSSDTIAPHRQPTPPVAAIPPAAIQTPPSPTRLDRLREAFRSHHPAVRDRPIGQSYRRRFERFFFSGVAQGESKGRAGNLSPGGSPPRGGWRGGQTKPWIREVKRRKKREVKAW